MATNPLFLARAVYRRRRLRDAARLLPLVGMLLMLLPALGRGEGSDASHAIFLFVVWGLLIAAAAILAPHLRKSEADGEPDREGQPLPLAPVETPEVRTAPTAAPPTAAPPTTPDMGAR